MPLIVKCSNCRAETPWENNPHRPFCSDRCQLIDLGAWAAEKYRVPAEEAEYDLDDEDAFDGAETDKPTLSHRPPKD
ncbi:MAG: DNA gyrase inhibitor YacG [Deltaproteobacteria bacterium]|nr:DNA gyrase inhibitor YacG [Deltaproteobacteria bacterium]